MTVPLFSSRKSPRSEKVDGPADGNKLNAEPKPGLEAGALLCLALALFLALALVSARYDPHDPSVHGRDFMGPVGAFLAGILIQAFGLVAWLVPVKLALVGAPLVRGRRAEAWALRLAGDLLIFVIVSALVQVAAPQLLVFGAAPAGGNVGLFFGELMRALFSTWGSFLVGCTLVLLIGIGEKSFSFLAACQRSLGLLMRLGRRLSVLRLRLVSAWREARQLREARRSKEQTQSAPTIDEQPSDDAIIMQLDEEPSDFSFEETGPPPLALSERLQQATVGTDSMLSAQPPVQRLEEAASEPDGVSSDRPRKRSRKQPEGPKIIDTKPQQRVERSRRNTKPRTNAEFASPNTSLLSGPPDAVESVDREALLQQATLLEKTLADYGVSGKVEEIHPGPTVTTYEVAPQAGTKVSKVASLCDDLALGLSRKVRIIAPIPGKGRIGFELPNERRIPVNLRELVEDTRFEGLGEKAPLPVVLGRDIVGAPYYADLASMPHVIVAGATGAGKSVGLNVMLASLLFKRSPDELRLLMIDPKVVELAPFDGIPHMLLPVVTDMKQAATALKWAVDEMERRYQLFANAGTKNILTYNRWVERVEKGEVVAPPAEHVEALAPEGGVVSVPAAKTGDDGHAVPYKLPFIVIVVDEFADLMMQQGKDVEASVARLAQKARAAGMHVVLATQRPSVDVITGMIKANFPSRVAYRVAQKVDSRTILDEQGAELLLGKGDMLVKLNGSTETRRVQCPFISEEEVSRLTDYLRTQGAPEYHEAILQESEDEASQLGDEPADARFDEAVRIVGDTQRCSTSWLQRKMTIGYNRAAKIVEMMEKLGMVGPANGARDREVYVQPQ